MKPTIARLNIESFRRKLEDETDETSRQMLVELLSEEQAKLAALEEESAGNISIRPSVLALATPAQTSTVLRDPGPDPSPTPHPVRARLALTPEPAGHFLRFARQFRRTPRSFVLTARPTSRSWLSPSRAGSLWLLSVLMRKAQTQRVLKYNL